MPATLTTLKCLLTLTLKALGFCRNHLDKIVPGAGFHYQSCQHHPTLSLHSRSGCFQRFLSVKHVQISIAARDARSPAQCDCLEAFLDHCAATQDLQELEELGRQMDTSWWLNLLLQHFKRLR